VNRASVRRDASWPRASTRLFESRFDRLRLIGFNQAVAQALAALDATSLQDATPARVVEVQRDSPLVHDGALERRARIHPRLARELAELAPYLGAGRTIVLLGSSGAGKSTLTNTLVDQARGNSFTNPVRLSIRSASVWRSSSAM
jgi:ABC-type transport system involved in cytochrome bd biosynthesis fused ATPase/permease subunit